MKFLEGHMVGSRAPSTDDSLMFIMRVAWKMCGEDFVDTIVDHEEDWLNVQKTRELVSKWPQLQY